MPVVPNHLVNEPTVLLHSKHIQHSKVSEKPETVEVEVAVVAPETVKTPEEVATEVVEALKEEGSLEPITEEVVAEANIEGNVLEEALGSVEPAPADTPKRRGRKSTKNA